MEGSEGQAAECANTMAKKSGFQPKKRGPVARGALQTTLSKNRQARLKMWSTIPPESKKRNYEPEASFQKRIEERNSLRRKHQGKEAWSNGKTGESERFQEPVSPTEEWSPETCVEEKEPFYLIEEGESWEVTRVPQTLRGNTRMRAFASFQEALDAVGDA